MNGNKPTDAEVLEALEDYVPLDYIDIYRLLKQAGRKRVDQAKAIHNALLERLAPAAVRREALEEAAKIVENYELAGMGVESVDDHFSAQMDDIAAAIRQIKG